MARSIACRITSSRRAAGREVEAARGDGRFAASTIRSNRTAAWSRIASRSTSAATWTGAPAAVTSMLALLTLTTIGSGSGGGGGGGAERPTWPPPGMTMGAGVGVGVGVGGGAGVGEGVAGTGFGVVLGGIVG